ncbi:MAG: YolA family protein [Candidatus Accumulibacter sp.]|nr:YolA family protein [Accumulibacter sp.]
MSNKKLSLVASLVLAALASTSAHADPAPNLSSVRVFAVGSTLYDDWEYISPGAYSTSYDHGGQILQVAVLEFGYGLTRIGKMNGSTVPKIESGTVCGTPSNFTLECSAGQTVTGFMHVYDLSGYQNGTFTYETISINGGGTFYAQIYIQ